MQRIREVMDMGKKPFYLKTVLGVGYKFSADSVGK